jgi:hypothetical protein
MNKTVQYLLPSAFTKINWSKFYFCVYWGSSIIAIRVILFTVCRLVCVLLN